jgi:hypothetical protein
MKCEDQIDCVHYILCGYDKESAELVCCCDFKWEDGNEQDYKDSIIDCPCYRYPDYYDED